MTFSERLTALLRFEKIKQKDLAEMVGVSKATVSQWCNGVIPTLPNIALVARHLSVKIDTLLGYEPILDELLEYFMDSPRLIS